MFKYSPRRSNRSRGFKVKHALQLFLLVSVSLWLLYQVKHSRNHNAKDTIKLGRKDLLPRIDNKIIDHSEESDNVELKVGVRGEANQNLNPLHEKQEREDPEESKDDENDEKDSEEIDNEGDETKDEGETENEEKGIEENGNYAHDEAAREMHYKGDDASSAVTHESINATVGNEQNQLENPEFVQWSNTNSTEAYIHQDERARNMIGTETEKDSNKNKTAPTNRVIKMRIATKLRNRINSSLWNSTVGAHNSKKNPKEAEIEKNITKITANSTYRSRKFLFRGQNLKSNGSNTKNVTDSDKGANGDANADDVQKLKEMVDYSSVIRKKDESSVVDNANEEETDNENGTGNSSIDRGGKGVRPNLMTLAGSLAEGRSSQ